MLQYRSFTNDSRHSFSRRFGANISEVSPTTAAVAVAAVEAVAVGARIKIYAHVACDERDELLLLLSLCVDYDEKKKINK